MATKSALKIGWIGMGRMGYPMAEMLLKAGYDVSIWNRTRSKAEPLAKIAELIESTARFCVESRRFPDELVKDVVELRRMFEQTVELFDKATNPLVSRVPVTGFGRKVGNQGFGRI